MSNHFGKISIDSAPSTPPAGGKKRPPRKSFLAQLPKRIPGYAVAAVTVLLLFTGYCIIGFWGVPHYITGKLAARLNQQTGLNVTAPIVSFNPFTFELDLLDLTVHDENAPADKAELLRINSLSVDLAPLSLLRTDLVCNRLHIDGLALHLVRNNEGYYNVSRLFTGEDNAQPSDFLNFSELPFLFSLNNISVANSSLTFQDMPTGNTHTVEQIELTLPTLSNFSFQTGEYLTPSFSAIINGSPIEFTGQTVAGSEGDAGGSPQTELSCTFQTIDLPLYINYLPKKLPFNVNGGKAEGSLQLTFSPEAAKEKLSIGFKIIASGVEIEDQQDKLTARLPSVRLEGTMQPVTGNTHLHNIVLQEPALLVSDQAPLQTIADLINPKPAADHDQSTTELPATLAIDLLVADNGTLSLQTAKEHKTKEQWQAIQLSLKNYTGQPVKAGSEVSPGSFNLSAQHVGSKAILDWQGTLANGNQLTGRLHLEALPAGTLFTWLNLSSLHSSSGTTDIEAVLSIGKKEKDAKEIIHLSKGVFTFRDLTLKEGKQTWLTAPEAQLGNVSLTESHLSLGDIRIPKGTAQLLVNKPPQVFSQIAAKKQRVTLNGIDYTGDIALKDSDAILPTLPFTDVSLRGVDLHNSNTKNAQANLTVKAKLGDSGICQAKGNVRLKPFGTSLLTGFSGIDSTQILPWFGKNALLTTSAALLSGKGTFTYPHVSYSGRLQLSNGSLKDEQSVYFTWQSLDFQDFHYTGKPVHMSAGEVALRQPHLQLSRNVTSKHNIAEFVTFLATHLPARTEHNEKSATEAPLEIGKTVITEGSIQLSENRLNPAWRTQITDISGSIDSLNSKTNQLTDFLLQGMYQGVPCSFEGSFNLFDLQIPGSSIFRLEGLPVQVFSQQLSSDLGLNTEHATLNVEVHDGWQNGQLSETAHFTFDNVTADSGSTNTALTLALLSNADHQFSLEINRKKELGERFPSLFTDTLATFKRLVVKTSVSPLLLVADNFADLIDQERAESLPGQATLAPNSLQALQRFGALLLAHPNIGLTLTGCANTNTDGQPLKEQLEQTEQQRVATENNRRATAWQKDRNERLQEFERSNQLSGVEPSIIEQEIPADQLDAYGPVAAQPVTVDKRVLQDLAKERAEVVRDYLIDQFAITPERIQIAPKAQISDSPGTTGHTSISLNVYMPATTGRNE